MSTMVTVFDPLEVRRRAVVSDLGATLGEQPEFRAHAAQVSNAMEPALARAIHLWGWMVEPTDCDAAQDLAPRYGQGRRRQRIVALFLREAAAALRFAPPDVGDPHEYALICMMNLGSIASTPEGEAAGGMRNPSVPALNSRERGCLGIARRGASRCVVCDQQVDLEPDSGAVRTRSRQPLSCSERCRTDQRHHTEAMQRVFDLLDWLLAEAIPLPMDLLP